MHIVRIICNSPTLDGELLPKWMYTVPMRLLENNKDNIAVRYKNQAYWFEKKYIERYI